MIVNTAIAAKHPAAFHQTTSAMPQSEKCHAFDKSINNFELYKIFLPPQLTESIPIFFAAPLSSGYRFPLNYSRTARNQYP